MIRAGADAPREPPVDRLQPNGLLVVYNYFREKWLVDRLANTAAQAFGAEPRVHLRRDQHTSILVHRAAQLRLLDDARAGAWQTVPESE